MRDAAGNAMTVAQKAIAAHPPEPPETTGLLEIKPATIKTINESAALQSVLYDNNLLPECVRTESQRDRLEYFVAGFMYALTAPAPDGGLREAWTDEVQQVLSNYAETLIRSGRSGGRAIRKLGNALDAALRPTKEGEE